MARYMVRRARYRIRLDGKKSDENRSKRSGIKVKWSVLGQQGSDIRSKGAGIRSESSGIGSEGSGIMRRVRYLV